MSYLHKRVNSGSISPELESDDEITEKPVLKKLATSGIMQYSNHGDVALIGVFGVIAAFGYCFCPRITLAAFGVFVTLQIYKQFFPESKPLPEFHSSLTPSTPDTVTLEGLYIGEGEAWVEHKIFPSLGRSMKYAVKVHVKHTSEGRIATIVVDFKQTWITAEWSTRIEAEHETRHTGATIIKLSKESHKYDGNVHGYGIIRLNEISQKGDRVVGRFQVQGISDNFGFSFCASDVFTLKKQIPKTEDPKPHVYIDPVDTPSEMSSPPPAPLLPRESLRARNSLLPGESPALSPSKSYRPPIETTSQNKRAVVLSVFKHRDKLKALGEAFELENDLMKAGYKTWYCQQRINLPGDRPMPISTTRAHINEFNRYFLDCKKHNKLDGMFIMIVAHGCTKKGKPMLQLEDEDGAKFDLEEWLVNTVSGTEYPIICCVNSCRVLCPLMNQKPKIQHVLDPPNNIFLSWGSAAGELAIDDDMGFVNTWRKNIAADFYTDNIVKIADEVHRGCKIGKFHNGLDPNKGQCVNGVWASKKHLPLPTVVRTKAEKDSLNKCIEFAKRAAKANKSDFDFTKYSDPSELAMADNSSIQGKMILITETDLFAVMCCDSGTKIIHGMVFPQDAGDSLAKLVESVEQRKLEMTDVKTIFYHSREDFLKATK